MRSMAPRAPSGWISHTLAMRSHSFGPREPYAARKSSNPARKARGPRWPDGWAGRHWPSSGGPSEPPGRSSRPGTPASKRPTARRRPDRARQVPHRERGFAGVGLDARQQPDGHGGVAEPLADGPQRTGADRRAHRDLHAGLEHLLQVGHHRAGAGEERGIGHVLRTGRSARSRSAMAFSASSSGTLCVDITHAIDVGRASRRGARRRATAPPRRAGRPGDRRSTPGRSPPARHPGMRAPISRVSESGL